MDTDSFDLLVIGGGINGAGIARDAAGRNLSVLLVEQGDLAEYTSSASTKLIHGGLRYLEYGEFRLVREALIERERLWGMAPHLIQPMDFVLPQVHSPRPAWTVRAGLFLYDHLGGRKRLPATRTVDLSSSTMGHALQPGTGKAFVYSDCRVDDSRLVVVNAIDAAERGACIATRTTLLSALRATHGWQALLENGDGERTVHARAIVNAAGPWVEDVLQRVSASRAGGKGIRLVKGSHIVVPRLYAGDHAFLLQNSDRRVVFAIPYQDDFTLIGTTEESWTGPPGPATISPAEVDYLCATINAYFVPQLSSADVVWSYAGIRPLFDDRTANASAVTRDYVLDLDAGENGAPLLSIFGGKITTFRRLAEQAMDRLAPFFPGCGRAWTAGAILLGGDLPDGDLRAFQSALTRSLPRLCPSLLRRLSTAYGTRIANFISTDQCLGRDLGDGIHEAEIAYLQRMEWAQTVQDVLWRRSKLGLVASPQTVERVAQYMQQNRPSRSWEFASCKQLQPP